jgi:hypothetical protein
MGMATSVWWKASYVVGSRGSVNVSYRKGILHLEGNLYLADSRYVEVNRSVLMYLPNLMLMLRQDLDLRIKLKGQVV